MLERKGKTEIAMPGAPEESKMYMEGKSRKKTQGKVQ